MTNKITEAINETDLDGLYIDGKKPEIKMGIKNIDGFDVSTYGTFTPTSSYLFNMYNRFNNKYFEGELPYLDVSKFKISKNSTCLGLTEAYCRRTNKYTNKLIGAEILSVSVSINYDRTEFVYLSTLLHEMIHVYQYYVLLICADHGKTFHDKMDELNSKGDWKISVTESREEVLSRGDVNKDILDKIKRTKYFGYIKRKDGNGLLGFIFPKKNLGLSIDKVKRFNHEYNIYEILDAHPFTDWQATTMKSTLSGYNITMDKVKEMEDKMIIKDAGIKFNEAIERANSDPMIHREFVTELPDGSIVEKIGII